MLVEVKEWGDLSKKGHPRAQIFNRIVHGGDVFDIPDTAVIHEVDSDVEIDPSTKKPKKERLITHLNVRVSPNPNVDTQDMTEYEYRMHTIKTTPMGQRWSKTDKELNLKYYWYTPEWMKPASRNSQPNINKEDSMPSRDGRDIPNAPPGSITSIGLFDTGQYVGRLNNMSNEEAILNINKTHDAALLNEWLADAKKQGKERLVNTIEAQLQTAGGS